MPKTTPTRNLIPSQKHVKTLSVKHARFLTRVILTLNEASFFHKENEISYRKTLSEYYERFDELPDADILSIEASDQAIEASEGFDKVTSIQKEFDDLLQSRKPMTVDFLQDKMCLVKKNSQFLPGYFYDIYPSLEEELEVLVTKEVVAKTECSICCTASVTHRHCVNCRGMDKLVCKGCIVKMFTIRHGVKHFEYHCPHCRTHIIEPEWAKKNIAALTKKIQFYEKGKRT
jgi:hypothetical protein